MRCDTGSAGGTARTWQIAGHHYALITVAGLSPGTETPYQVLLDGAQVWPQPGSPLPAQHDPHPRARPERPQRRLRLLPLGRAARRQLARPGRPRRARHPRPARHRRTANARTCCCCWATRCTRTRPPNPYARRLADPRSVRAARQQVADYEEYTRLYDESWLDPEVRWLLSTVPSCMIFDDHDVIDDWNTSESWLGDMRATRWWRERILSGLMSYWVYQHLGNLSPAELATDPPYAAVRTAEDGTAMLREFADARGRPSGARCAGATAATSAAYGC